MDSTELTTNGVKHILMIFDLDTFQLFGVFYPFVRGEPVESIRRGNTALYLVTIRKR